MLESLSTRLDHAHLFSSQRKTFDFDRFFTRPEKLKKRPKKIARITRPFINYQTDSQTDNGFG